MNRFIRRGVFSVFNRPLLSKSKRLAGSSSPRVNLHALSFGSPVFRIPSTASSNSRPYSATIGIMKGQHHYGAHTSETYEQAYFYEPGPYQEYLVDRVRQRLDLAETKNHHATHILDIGGGTGNFALALLQGIQSVTVVDPFLDPTASLEDREKPQNIVFVKEGAEAFLQPASPEQATWRTKVDRILLKEVVHHLEDRVGIFRGMYEDLTPSPNDNSILIVTRPQVDIDYPLWDAARTVWKKNQPSAEMFMNELQQAGFVGIEQSIEAYPCQISWHRWKEMVQTRFWSTFSNFTDQELADACQTMDKDYQDQIDDSGIIRFEDRLVFISAKKMES